MVYAYTVYTLICRTCILDTRFSRYNVLLPRICMTDFVWVWVFCIYILSIRIMMGKYFIPMMNVFIQILLEIDLTFTSCVTENIGTKIGKKQTSFL